MLETVIKTQELVDIIFLKEHLVIYVGFKR